MNADNLPPCDYRTNAETYLVCRHARVRGFALNIVPPRTCGNCVWREVPCQPRPVARWIGLRAWLAGFRLGDLVKRAIALATLGVVRPRPGCGCDRRRVVLNRAVRRWING